MELSTSTGRAAPPFSPGNKIGFGLSLLLGSFSILSAASGPPSADQPGPPLPVVVASVALGVVIIGAVGFGWATGNRVAIRGGAIAVVLSMLLAVPALFVEGIPAGVRAGVGGALLLTIATVVLMLTPAKPARPGGEG